MKWPKFSIMDIGVSIAVFALALSAFNLIAIVDRGRDHREMRALACLSLLLSGVTLTGLSVGVLLHRRLKWTLIALSVGVLGLGAIVVVALLIGDIPTPP